MSGTDHLDPKRWDRAIDMLQRAGDYAHVPLLEAAKVGLIDIVFVRLRTAALPFGRMRKSPRPVLALIGDDDDFSSGPGGWHCAGQVTQWARGAIVHGSGAQRQHYELAVRGALACQRFIVVDTASRHVGAWMALLSHAQGMVVLPREGEHPIAEVRSPLH